MRSYSRQRLAVVTSVAMAAATFQLVVFSALASDLIEEFDLSRAQLGLLATATGLVGALCSPAFGRLTDRLGSNAATRGVLTVGALSLLGIAVSPSYGLLLVAALFTGLGNGWGNPATNALIVDTIRPGARGVITGVKQSGVQMGTFLGGALLPVFTRWWSWRIAVAAFVIMPLLTLAATIGRHPTTHHEIAGDWVGDRLPRAVWWIAAYGLISGLATSAIFAFLPLFAVEDQEWTAQGGGLLLALVGLVGIGARILWSTASEKRLGHGPTLRILGVLSTLSAILLALVSLGLIQAWLLVPAAILLALGSIAWNAVGMLAVMDLSHPTMVGKGTGIVLLGFLLGYSLGSPIMGYSVDVLGTYTPGWIGAAALLALTAIIASRVPVGGTVVSS